MSEEEELEEEPERDSLWTCEELGDIKSRFNATVKCEGKIVAYTIYKAQAEFLADCAEALRDTCPEDIASIWSIKYCSRSRKTKAWIEGYWRGISASGVLPWSTIRKIRSGEL